MEGLGAKVEEICQKVAQNKREEKWVLGKE